MKTVAVLAVSVCLAFCGCISASVRTMRNAPRLNPYEPTTDVAKIVAFEPYWGGGEEREVGLFLCLFAFIPSFVDLPFEFAVDTVCLPYDVHALKRYRRNKGN